MDVPPAGDPAEAGDPRLRIITAVLSLGSFLVVLDTTVVNVALETLGRSFDTSLSQTQWVSSAYLLTLAVVIPLTAWASHRVGARRLWLFAVAMFVVGSALCALAWSIDSLIAARVLQGIGGGMIPPLGQAIVIGAAGERPLGRVMSTLNLPLLVAPILGPAAGGLLLGAFGWPAIFVVNVPLGLIALLVGRSVLPATVSDRGRRLDVPGVLLLCPGMAAFVFGVVQVGGQRASAASLVALAGGVVLIAGFVVHAHRAGSRALIDVSLFRKRAFAAPVAVAFSFQFVHAGVLAVLPLYFQVARGESPLDAGLLVGIQGLGSLAALMTVGWASDRFGPARVARLGLTVALLATLPFVALSAHTPYVLLAGLMIVRGFGISATMTPAYAAAYEPLERSSVPTATTALNIVSRVGASLAVAALLLITESGFASAGGDPERLAGAVGVTFVVVIGCTVFALAMALLMPGRPTDAVAIRSARGGGRGPRGRAAGQ